MQAGDSETATWRTRQFGAVRVRMVEYSPGYMADHWCSRGHILLVLEGTLTTELANGEIVTIKAGTNQSVIPKGVSARSIIPRAFLRHSPAMCVPLLEAAPDTPTRTGKA